MKRIVSYYTKNLDWLPKQILAVEKKLVPFATDCVPSFYRMCKVTEGEEEGMADVLCFTADFAGSG